MTTFGWLAGMRDPPWLWDLRRLGWSLCRGREGLRAERPFNRDGEVAEQDALDAYQRRNALWAPEAEFESG